ncbi:MAG: OmpA family protein [Clostridia bacterium]|nr:OmpA family protein [Clostridia bacterium]
MIKFRITALILAMLMILSLFAGCGKNVTDKNNNTVNGKFTDYLIAEKIGALISDKFETSEGGLYYKGENGLYGVASHNGMYDTGTIFEEVQPVGKYFQVRTKAPKSADDIAGLNSSKLIDSKGRTIVPEGYMSFYEENEHYIKVATVTGKTNSKDNVVASRSDNGACFNGEGAFSDKCVLYKGTWYVYDIINKRIVPGVSGEKDQSLIPLGRFIKYSKNNQYITVDENGDELSNASKVFDNGSYTVEGKVGEVYDETGKLLFSYDLAGFKPNYLEYGYYVSSKYSNGTTKYAVMDNTGKVISTEFDDMMTLYGEIFECNGKIYNLEGKNIIKGKYKTVRRDETFGQYYMLINDDYYTLIDKNGSVFFNGPYDDNHTVSSDDMLASKEIDGKTFYYSYKDQDYTIKGSSFAPWVVKTESNNNLYDLVDTMTGKKLLEGYSSYDKLARDSSAYYIYAKYNNGADIYLIEAGSQLEDITKKKEDLFADLSSAFEQEGIKVTVNRENGEIALDSSVLFGGDSAELTGEGKAFLNKFIKAYTSVASSEKYNSFIAKTMVEGHTAPVSGSTYESGLQLSEERALNVKNYCLSSETGVDVSAISNKLENIGYSNSKPVYDSNGNVNMAASRRVSFRFIVNVDD